jgi:hypothetical protein
VDKLISIHTISVTHKTCRFLSALGYTYWCPHYKVCNLTAYCLDTVPVALASVRVWHPRFFEVS